MYAKWIVFIILLIACLTMVLPKPSYIEGFNELQGRMTLDNINSKVFSTMLYIDNKDTTEEDYLGAIEEQFPISSLGEPLIMNRCIQFAHDRATGRGGLDAIIQQLYRDNKFFVSEKIQMPYRSYDDIENTLFRTLNRLYVDSNKNSGVRIGQFYSPCYVLITQYPYARTVKPDCTVVQRTLQWDAINNEFNPKTVDNNNGCKGVAGDVMQQDIWVEMYILMPAHRMIMRNRKRLVGELMYKTWGEIRCNMRRLFAYNPNKSFGVSVVNPRSFDEKCQFQCLSRSSNKYNYICGARNHTTVRGKAWPYESTVLGTHNDPLKHDYGILYLLNGEYINQRLGYDSIKGIFGNCIDVEAIPLNYNTTTAACGTVVKPKIPDGPKTILLEMEDVPFQIRVQQNKCLAIDSNNDLVLVNPIVDDIRQRWQIEKVAVPRETEFLYLIYVTIARRKLYLTKNIFNKPVFTTSKPTNTAFKPRSDQQLRLVEISRSGINWNTERYFCLTVSPNELIFMSECVGDTNIISFVPLALPSNVCGVQLTNEEFLKNLEHANKN